MKYDPIVPMSSPSIASTDDDSITIDFDVAVPQWRWPNMTKPLEGEEDLMILKILDVRIREGRKEYLVRFNNNIPDTWEWSKNISCPNLIKRFNMKRNGTTKPTKTPKSVPKLRKVLETMIIGSEVVFRVKNEKGEVEVLRSEAAIQRDAMVVLEYFEKDPALKKALKGNI